MANLPVTWNSVKKFFQLQPTNLSECDYIFAFRIWSTCTGMRKSDKGLMRTSIKRPTTLLGKSVVSLTDRQSLWLIRASHKEQYDSQVLKGIKLTRLLGMRSMPTATHARMREIGMDLSKNDHLGVKYEWKLMRKWSRHRDHNEAENEQRRMGSSTRQK